MDVSKKYVESLLTMFLTEDRV